MDQLVETYWPRISEVISDLMSHDMVQIGIYAALAIIAVLVLTTVALNCVYYWLLPMAVFLCCIVLFWDRTQPLLQVLALHPVTTWVKNETVFALSGVK